MAALLGADLGEAATVVLSQLGHCGYSESVLQTALQIEMQTRGYCVQTEVSFPVTFETSTGVQAVAGQVRVDVLIKSTVDPLLMVVVEVKKSAAGNHAAQLSRYQRALPSASVVLFTPEGLTWHSSK